MCIVEIKGKQADGLFNYISTTPVTATPGYDIVPLHTINLPMDSAGRLPGDVGYTGPIVQTPILKIVTDDILYADLTTDSYTFSSAVDAIAIKNDGTSNLTITIATLLFTIKPGESRIIEMAPFTVVAFSANATFRMNGLRRS